MFLDVYIFMHWALPFIVLLIVCLDSCLCYDLSFGILFERVLGNVAPYP
jgi:hypothetical protein